MCFFVWKANRFEKAFQALQDTLALGNTSRLLLTTVPLQLDVRMPGFYAVYSDFNNRAAAPFGSIDESYCSPTKDTTIPSSFDYSFSDASVSDAVPLEEYTFVRLSSTSQGERLRQMTPVRDPLRTRQLTKRLNDFLAMTKPDPTTAEQLVIQFSLTYEGASPAMLRALSPQDSALRALTKRRLGTTYFEVTGNMNCYRVQAPSTG